MDPQLNSSEKIRHKKKLLAARENNILKAAIELCLSQGIENVTVSKIADRAGIGKGTIYKHFITKNELLVRIILNYETALYEQLLISDENPKTSTSENMVRIYINARLIEPITDNLIKKLELYLAGAEGTSLYLEELFRIRKAISEILGRSIKQTIKNDALDNMPESYYYLACQTLIQSVIEVHSNDSLEYNLHIQDLLAVVAKIGKAISDK